MAKDKPNVFYNRRESSTNQAYFLQNKANLLAVSKIPKMNITSATTVNYINELRTTNYELIMKNKPNSKPIKANFKTEVRRQKTEDRRQSTALPATAKAFRAAAGSAPTSAETSRALQ